MKLLSEFLLVDYSSALYSCLTWYKLYNIITSEIRPQYLSKSISISQCGVCGKRSTAMAFTGRKGSETGIDLAQCRAKPALLMFLQPRLSFFPFLTFSTDGVKSSMAFATKLSGLQEIYLRNRKRIEFRLKREGMEQSKQEHKRLTMETCTSLRRRAWVLKALITWNFRKQ